MEDASNNSVVNEPLPTNPVDVPLSSEDEHNVVDSTQTSMVSSRIQTGALEMNLYFQHTQLICWDIHIFFVSFYRCQSSM